MDEGQLIRSIAILEARIHHLKEEPKAYEEVFPAQAQCLYYHLLGENYLAKHSSSTKLDSNNLIKALDIVRDGVKLSIMRLDPADETRLLCANTYCKCLIVFDKSPMKAKFVAENIFEEAIEYDNILDEQALTLLQKLRNDFMLYEPNAENNSSDSNAVQLNQDLDDQVELFAVKYDKSKASDKSPSSHRNEQIDAIKPLSSLSKSTIAKKIRRGVSVNRPVSFESIASSASMLRALDSIFRAYVRGNAVPGQLAGGNAVDFVGQTLTFRSFILNGPYLSWKGFLSFLLDFSIAKAPKRSTKTGKTFYRSLSSTMREAFVHAAGGAQEPLLGMVEAAVIFIEAAQSFSPALVMNKFLPVYAEMANNVNAPDVWQAVLAWSEDESEQEWDIPFGLNFMQFVDCVGKMGLIGYSTPYFMDMLPSVPEKIAHFLSAYLGLADKRKWSSKVERKVQTIKAALAQLTKQGLEKPKGRKEIAK